MKLSKLFLLYVIKKKKNNKISHIEPNESQSEPSSSNLIKTYHTSFGPIYHPVARNPPALATGFSVSTVLSPALAAAVY